MDTYWGDHFMGGVRAWPLRCAVERGYVRCQKGSRLGVGGCHFVRGVNVYYIVLYAWNLKKKKKLKNKRVEPRWQSR